MAATSIDDGDAIGLDLNSTRLLEHLSIAKRPEHDDNMVYCGKLSRACQRCRQRKIKARFTTDRSCHVRHHDYLTDLLLFPV